MDKAIWKAFISRDFIPRFRCPTCAEGRLLLNKNELLVRTPYYARRGDPADAEGRFVFFLKCDNRVCGEFVSACGITITVGEADQDGNFEYFEYLEPIMMSPAPHIIALPDKLPAAVEKEVILSFGLYWTDHRVCASRLRTSLERLMDHFGVARFRVAKNPKNPAGPGKRRPIELASRIEMLPRRIGSGQYSQTLHALRVVGNLGTHGTAVKKETLLDAYELYEIALAQLFDERATTAKEIIKRLKRAK